MSNRQIIQRAAFVKRAPSGKLSAFKKWEKKWMVFVVNGLKEPYLDFFDDRAQVGKTQPKERLDLKKTKQVIAAIDCKVPHNFLIITEEKIISLAAITLEDRDVWIAVLRRVLADVNCIQSKEDHDYEIHRSITRQQQVQASVTRRPPPPLPVDDDDDPEPPPPPRISSASRNSRSLPPRQTLSSMIENDFVPNRRLQEQAIVNARELLEQYDDSPESSYEYGDRRAIAEASELARQQIRRRNDTESSDNQQIPPPVPIYTSLRHRSPVRRARVSSPSRQKSRPAEPMPRIEHDFFPSQRRLPVARPRREEDSTAQATAPPHQATSLANDSTADQSDDTYVMMDPHIEPLPIALELRDAPVGYKSNLTCSELVKESVKSSNSGSDRSFNEIIASRPSPPAARHSVAVKTKMTLPLPKIPKQTNNLEVYENSITVKDPKTGSKATPAPAPRRKQSQAQTPTDGNEECYENAMGVFGMGRTSAKSASAFEGPTHTGKTPTRPKAELPAGSPSLLPQLPLPPTPVNNRMKTDTDDAASIPEQRSHTKTTVQPKMPVEHEDIPLADAEDSDIEAERHMADQLVKNSPVQPPLPPLPIPPVDQGCVGSSDDPSDSDDDTAAPQQIYPSNTGEPSMADAPPPYSPPRLLNDNQGNMDAIGEHEEEEIKSPPAISPIDNSREEHHETSPDADNLYDVPSSPRPTLPEKRRQTLLVRKNSADVLRLEDTFPRMPNANGANHTTPDEHPTLPLPSRSAKNPLSKSYSSALPASSSLGRATHALSSSNDEEQDVKPRKPPKAYSHRRRSNSFTKDTVHRPVEYESVIPARKPAATPVDEPPKITRRRETKVINQERGNKRKSAPPGSLPGVNAASASSPKPGHDKRPLSGGSLALEGKIYRSPQRENDFKNLPLKQAQIETLKQEIGHYYGVRVTVFKKEVKYAMFVDFMTGIWVAGWNQKERPLLHNIFHIGDKIVSVNSETFTSASKLLKMIRRADSDTRFDFLIRRIPYGKAYFVHRMLDQEDIGVHLKSGSAEICGITTDSLIAKQGLRLNPNRAYGPGQCHWVITEVNHRPLNILDTGNDVEARLKAVGKDITLVVQPFDIVDAIKRELKSIYGYREYLLK